MTHTEIKNQLFELSLSFKNDTTDLQDAEILERSALRLIAEYIQSNNYHIDGNPGIELPENIGELITDKMRYIVDCVSIYQDSVLDLNWTFKNSFWETENESKEEYHTLLKEMTQNKDLFYNLDDDF